MGIHAIATIKSRVKEKNILGLRLLETNTREIKDVLLSNVIEVVKSGKTQVENVEVVGNDIAIGGGSIDSYPVIVKGRIVGKSPLIILQRLGENIYTVCDYSGSIKTIRMEEVIEYGKQHGIANGRIVNNGRGEYISQIKGDYINEIKITARLYAVQARNGLWGFVNNLSRPVSNFEFISIGKLKNNLIQVERLNSRGCRVKCNFNIINNQIIM